VLRLLLHNSTVCRVLFHETAVCLYGDFTISLAVHEHKCSRLEVCGYDFAIIVEGAGCVGHSERIELHCVDDTRSH
jgi:hypothetical protein